MTKSQRQADTDDEIEITEEMIAAGARILGDFYDELPSAARQYAALIFKVMIAERHS